MILYDKKGDMEFKYIIYILLMLIVIFILFISVGQIDKLKDILLSFFRGFK